jgi:hypothetical protein
VVSGCAAEHREGSAPYCARWPTGCASKGFAHAWQLFSDRFHVEVLPCAAQDLVRGRCRPRQPVVLGFWRQILEEPAAELYDAVEQATEAVRASGVP